MKKLNLNSTVKVKLNPKGAEIYYHRLDNLVERRVDIRPTFPMVDQYGFTSFQLWIFMSLYGEHIDMCKPEVLDELYLYIDDEDLEDADCLMGYEVVEEHTQTHEKTHAVTIDNTNGAISCYSGKHYICPSCGKTLPEGPAGGYMCPYCGHRKRTKKEETNIDNLCDFSPVRTENGIKIGNIEITPNSIEIDGMEIGMDKPLKDWTFAEAQKFCKAQRNTPERCSTCKIQKFCDKYFGRQGESTSPKYWNLSDKPRFTQQEVEDAKTIRRILRDDGKLTRSIHGIPTYGCIYLKKEVFPSIRPGKSYTLDEIIGGADGIIQD